MDDLAERQIRAARTLFNLAHCYLKTTKIDVEKEKTNLNDEKDEVIKEDIQQKEKVEANENKRKKFVKKKKKKKCDSDNEIELYLEVQVDSNYQQQLCTDVKNIDLNKAPQKSEIEIDLKIEIPKELESSYLKNIGKEKHLEELVEEDEKKSKKNKQRENKQELINREISDDSEFQHNTEKEIKQNINKHNVCVDLGGNNIDCDKTQNQIQKGIEIESQKKDNSDILLELELQEQQNIHDNLIDSFHRSIQKRIERLICEIPLKHQKIEKELRQEIEKLNKEIKKLDPENVDELKKEILEDVSKKDYLPVQIKFLKNLYCSFNQDLTPFYNKLDQLSDDLTQTSIQQKLNNEFLKKLDNLLQQKCNEEIQERQQQGTSKVKHMVNEDVQVVGRKKKLKSKDELKRAVELPVNDTNENNEKIKEKELQENILKETQEGEKEKYQYYDLVIQYNQETSQELKGNAQNVLGKKVSVDFYDDAVKTFINQIDHETLKSKICKEGIDIIDQTQKKGNTNIQFQLEFYKSVEVEEKLQNKNDFEGEINRDLEIKTKETRTEVQEDTDVEIEDFEEELQDYSKIVNDEHFEAMHENTKLKIGALETTIIEDSGIKIGDSEKEVQEDSDVDIEGFEGEILEFPEVRIEDFDEESQGNTDVDTEDVSEEEINDVNEVVEIVEDIEVESNSSEDNYIPSEKTPTTTCNESHLKIDPCTKLKHDKEKNLKKIDSSNPTILTDHIKEKQTFFELKNQLDELSQEYKGYVQQKVFDKLQQEIDDKQLQEMKIFPDTFNEENLNTNEDFQKEIDELQNEWCQLEPEFIRDVPLSFEEDNSSQKSKEKPYNLFERLHFIHRKLLCKFANSKEWPENCFQPSSLLDVLFDDPIEFKPNVLVLILHSIDKGYSIKINTDKNLKSPKEYFFNYFKDTILEYMENEHLPPDLLDLLDSAEPRLFYSGCVIAEIHDQVDEIPGRVYRLLLRPFNLSIQSDVNRIIAKNSHPTDTNYWSYKKRLKLESILLKKSYPVMCMDSSPIAGLVVNLQHQMLSCRTIVLNPLRRKNNYSNQKLLKTDLYNESNDDIKTSMLSNIPQKESSKLMDTENMNIENYILWKFDFRIKSLNLFKLFLVIITETQEFSLLLCTNPKVDSVKKMRFKIQLKQNELKTYIIIMLEVLRQRISPDIEVVRRYKCQANSTPLSLKIVPSLFNDNVFKASHADISQLIDIFINNTHIKYIPINKMLENMFKHKSEITEFESEKSDLSLIKNKLAAETHKTVEIKETSKDLEIKKSMQFCTTKKLSTSSNRFLDLSKLNSIEKMTDSSPLQTQIIPKDILLDNGTISLLKEKSTNTERNSSLESSLIQPTLDLSKLNSIDRIADFSPLQTRTIPKDILLDDDTMLLLKKKSINIDTDKSSPESSVIQPKLDLLKLNSIDNIADFSSLQTQTIPKEILLDDDMPLLREKLTITETDSSLEPSLIMPILTVSKNDNSSDLEQENMVLVSNNSMVPVFSFITSTIPFESSPAVVLSSLSTINSLVTSIKTYMLPIESSSLGYIAKSESISLQTDDNSTFNGDDIYTNIKLLLDMQPEDLIHLMKVDDIAVNMFYGINPVTPTTCNDDTITMSPNENIFTTVSNSDYVENISVMKHTNESEVDLFGTMYNVNDNGMIQLHDTTNITKEIFEDKYILRCLQLFHQNPTLPDISIQSDISTLPDISIQPDISTLPDISIQPDISILPDISIQSDISILPDISIQPDISIPHDTQVDSYPKPGFSNDSLTNSDPFSALNALMDEILLLSNNSNNEEKSPDT